MGDQGEDCFRMKAIPMGDPRCIVIEVNCIRDLYKVVLKPANATILIPKLEFEIGPGGDKEINTIWNHLAQAIFNLGLEAKKGEWDDHTLNGVARTLDQLNELLDVNEP